MSCAAHCYEKTLTASNARDKILTQTDMGPAGELSY